MESVLRRKKFGGNWEIHEPEDAAHFVIRRRPAGQATTPPVDFQEQLDECVSLMESLKTRTYESGNHGKSTDHITSEERHSAKQPREQREAEAEKDTSELQEEPAPRKIRRSSLHILPSRAGNSAPPRRIPAKPLPESAKLFTTLGALLVGAWTYKIVPGLLILLISVIAIAAVSAYQINIGIMAFVLIVGLELTSQCWHWKKSMSPTLEYKLCEMVGAEILENKDVPPWSSQKIHMALVTPKRKTQGERCGIIHFRSQPVPEEDLQQWVCHS